MDIKLFISRITLQILLHAGAPSNPPMHNLTQR